MMKMHGLFVVLTMAFVCAGMWGCGDDVTTTYVGRRGGYLVALVDDSLALLYTVDRYDVCEDEERTIVGTTENCHKDYDNSGLHLVNYREKKPALWGEDLDFYVNFAEGYYNDSSVFVYDGGKFGFWKIGQKPELNKTFKWNPPCSGVGNAVFRPWKNGNVLLRGAKGCGNAVIDTSTGKVSKLEDEYLPWIEECDDVTYLDGHVMCLKAVYASDRYGVYLDVDGNVADSLLWNEAKWSFTSEKNVQISGCMFLLNHPLFDLQGNTNKFAGIKINSLLPFDYLRPMAGIADLLTSYEVFLDSLGGKIEYRSSDLLLE